MYKNGVSNAATNILKINAEKTSPTNCDQSSIWKIVKKKITEKEKDIGIIGVRYKKKKFSLTIFIDPVFQEKGYFSKALKFFLRRLHRYKPYLKHIYSQVHLSNKKMTEIMEKKFTFVKVFKIGNIPVAEYKIKV